MLTPLEGVLVIISRRWEQNQKHNRERPINTDSPRKKKKKKSVAVQWPNREIPGPKNTQNWHHFIRTSSSTRSYYLCLLTLLHLVLFCHHFPCENDVLITNNRIEFSNVENIAVAYTNFLSIASCRIVNIRYRNDLLVTEIRVVNSAVDTQKGPIVFWKLWYSEGLLDETTGLMCLIRI